MQQVCHTFHVALNAPSSRRFARSGPRSRPIRPADRGPAVRCGGWGKGSRGGHWARARLRGFSGVGSRWCAIHEPGRLSTWKAQPCFAYGWSITHLVWHARPLRRSVRSGQRIADRRCAAAAGGRGWMESAGLALVYEAFQGCCPHMVVRPMALRPPEKLNLVGIQRSHHASRVARTA